ncbi:Oidioi.mRNA.OKI2018_I69.chr2.g4671.t1.cds [Oikopleura dioica]|uniref:Oidioi.mRNA.OKI2018_I69.chr2.g4671.t1.cds n=1 Tax=Oikopleura dioica TaxID=34765 RepID=A0ABN7T4N2_OIKDI|nr:Oidioi.mRNA.OKI2018_I69.chr2.g4671.t1.cds [Oikopleura dioica]
MNMAQGYFAIPEANGFGVYCFPLSRQISRVRRHRTHIFDKSRHYSNNLQPHSRIEENSLRILSGSRQHSQNYCRLIAAASFHDHFEFNSSDRSCSLLRKSSSKDIL